ncbi:MAG: hypothetical protein GX657_05740 [Chloroflexi bacterium]|nr:hypothetical protein [Chloroflexota bacterium]
MVIGKIASSSSHIAYVCQVASRGEADLVPRPQDYGFGTFVGIERADGSSLVGVISDTTLLNPEFGSLGPRLSPRDDLGVFSPDYLEEKLTLVAIVVLGAVAADGTVLQGVPPVAAEIDAAVRRLAVDEVVAFHTGAGGVALGYVPLLTSLPSPLAPHLLLQIIEGLRGLFPQDAQRLSVLADNLAWKARVEPLG